MNASPVIPSAKVKICGITNRLDGERAVEFGADALGFNLWRSSKRFIDIGAESEWIRNLPSSVLKIAVMVNPSLEEAKAVFDLSYIDLIQFHGNESAEFCGNFVSQGQAFIKAFGLTDSTSFAQIRTYPTRYVLLDAYAPGVFGGTGKTIDWGLAAAFVSSHKELDVLLSGGLNPENVAEAIRRVRPYGVDIASGIEASPGRKDHALMRAFISAAKQV